MNCFCMENKNNLRCKKYLTYDDVLIKPAYSEITPGETSIKAKITKNIQLNIPFISSPMDSVTDYKMARQIALLGGIGFLHHNMPLKKQIRIIKKLNKEKLMIGLSMGVNGYKYLKEVLEKCKPSVIVIDNAHAHTKNMKFAIKQCKKYRLEVIAGNIATAAAAKFLIKAGADGIKVGIGSGSICTTRIVTGIGVPQLDAIREVYKICKDYSVPVLADGGVRYPADCCKALAAGASAVVLGSVIAGTKESPGKITIKKGKKFKIYRGMGSKEAMRFGSSERYNQDYLNESKLVEEGISIQIPYKGSIVPIINKFAGGLKNSLAYVGAKNLREYRKKARFIEISSAGFSESLPHILNSLN
jgi:IMP dehydrogenase